MHMPSSSSSSASSSAGSSPSSSPPPENTGKHSLKRKRGQAADPVSDSESSSSEEENEVEEDEEPVLSHAAKRKQKKKLKGDPSSTVTSPTKSSTTPSKKQKTSTNSKDKISTQEPNEKPFERPKRQNSVWVGNLSFKTTEDGLKRFFEGDAGEVTRVHMPIKAPVGPNRGKFALKENKGFAYVDFATEEGKKNAILMTEGHLDGRKLLIKDGDDFTGRPTVTAATADATSTSGISSKTKLNDLTGHSKTALKILNAQIQPPGPTLFFGNLGFETTQESLRAFLEAHRKVPAKADADGDVKMEDGEGGESGGGKKKDAWIRKVRMGTFEDSGLCKGWAFVDFTSTEHATAALTNRRNHQMDGRKLKVEYASPDAVRRGGGPGARPERSKTRVGARGDQDRSGGRDQSRSRGRQADTNEGQGEDADQGQARERRYEDKAGGRGGDGERIRLDRKGKPRAKPGAALAAAQREQAAIVPSQGKKITFDD